MEPVSAVIGSMVSTIVSAIKAIAEASSAVSKMSGPEQTIVNQAARSGNNPHK